jgi:hypothetical protein
MIADTIIRAGEVNPLDIIIYAPPDYLLAFPPLPQETTIILWATEGQAQAGADETDIVVTRGLPVISAPVFVGDSKLKRWTGTEWVTVGTIVVFQ